MANMVQKESYGAPQKQILIADGTAVTLGAQIGNAGVAEVDGKKIVKAGTPVAGDLLDRDTAFVVDTSAPTAVVLHDVDVTAGDANGTIISTGHIDKLKLDADVQAMITSGVVDALKAEGIKFINGSAV